MSSVKSVSEKPKKELNPIIKSMNEFRNNVIGPHIGSKAPVKTAPVFKMAIAAARTQMELEEGAKNTLEVVAKATELFQGDPDKYVNLSEKFVKEEKEKKEADKSNGKKTEKKKKSKKSKEESVDV
tara:strand:- start:324 stop:701 length:378 start_codon:yes stop_codon:yes gene_type:complete